MSHVFLKVEEVTAEAQAKRGCTEWFYSCDFNEKCPNVEYLIEFLNKVKEGSPAAFDRIQYLEQPTSRNLKDNPENKMHEAAKLKPVVIDEALVDYESLLLAREQGYTGVALKACKGQTESLLMAAAAQKFGMFFMRAGFDLSRLFVLTFGVTCVENPDGGCHRGQRTTVLSIAQQKMGQSLPRDVQNHRRYCRNGAALRRRVGVLIMWVAGARNTLSTPID